MGNAGTLNLSSKWFKDEETAKRCLSKVKIPKGGIVVIRVGDEAHKPNPEILKSLAANIESKLGKKFRKNECVAVILPYWIDIKHIGGRNETPKRNG